MKTKGKILNVLGDSITAGANATGFKLSYHQILKELGGFKEVNAYGVGGTRIAKQRVFLNGEKAEDCFITRAEMMKEKADVVLVFGGTNDYGHGDAPLGDLTDETDETFCGACRVLLKKLRVKYASSKIIVLLPLRRLNDDNPYGENGKKAFASASLDEYCELLKNIAQRFDCAICDLRAEKLLNPNDEEINNLYFGDGLHPNNAGHKILAEYLLQFMNAL